MIVKEFDPVGFIRHAVQASLNGRATADTRRRGKDWIILEVVRAGD